MRFVEKRLRRNLKKFGGCTQMAGEIREKLMT